MSFLPDPTINLKSRDGNYSLELEFQDIDTSIVNSLRRIMISELINVGISPDDVSIESNTTSLHNQFLTTRISMLPICSYDSNDLKILSYWDNTNAIRRYEFKTQSGIPEFKIDIKNDKETRLKISKHRPFDLEKDTIINVTSQDITFNNYHGEISEISKYFKPDMVSMEVSEKYQLPKNIYTSLNKLKLDTKGIGEEIVLSFHPSIGNGLKHTIYSTVGTVSFKNIQDESKLDEVFAYKVEKLNREREGKKLEKLPPDEELDYRKEFLTLDAKRVVFTDKRGDPNRFSLTVETIGSLTPIQLSLGSLYHLKWALKDLANTIFFSDKGYDVNPSKIRVEESPVIMDSIDIIIEREKHTLGNILSRYLQKLLTGSDALVKNVFAFSSYEVKHPLDKFMLIRLYFNPNVSLEKMVAFIKHTKCPENELFDILNSTNNSFSNKKLEKILCLFLLKLIIIPISKALQKMEKQLLEMSEKHRLFNNIINTNNIEYTDYGESYLRKFDTIIEKESVFLKQLHTADIFRDA